MSVEDEPAIDRLAGRGARRRPRRAGHRLAGAIAARDRRQRSASPHPLDPPTAQAATSKLRSASGSPRPACRTRAIASARAWRRRRPRRGARLPVRRQGARPAGPEGARARAGAGRRSTDGVRARARARALERGARRGARPGPRGDGERVLDRRPLPSADRHRPGRRAMRPAFGVALAHVWPSGSADEDVAAAVRGPRRRRRRSASRRADVHAGARRPGRAARRRGRRPARRRPRRRALRRRAGRRPEPARGRGGARRARSRGRARPRRAAGGACVRFLVPEPGELVAVEGLEAAARSSGVVWVRIYREPGTCSGRSGAAPTAPGPCSPSATRAGGRRPRGPRGRPRTLRHAEAEALV